MTAAKDSSGQSGFLAIDLDGVRPVDLATTVLAAESAGFHVATFADGPVLEGRPAHRLNALQRAAFAGPLTRSIALVPEVDTVYTEPFHVATQLASLDYVSLGRAGWIATAAAPGDGGSEAAAAVGRLVVDGTALAEEAAASIEVSRRLWDSWEDDAVIRDVATGRYLDASKLHYVDTEGPGYSVKGPAITPRPPQGQLPIFAPAALIGEGHVSPSAVDAVLVSAPTPELLAVEVRDARSRFGAGTAGGPAVIAELDIVLDARGASAAARAALLEPSVRARFVGTAVELTALLDELLAEADGVRLHPADVAVDLEELSRLVLPELRRRGALLPVRNGGTFRELLGLERPASRYASQSTSGIGE
ncbi:LLM class flavin-dependent oxidoreductase [Arthrobacter sp. M4]|uniref:LLM class flavin-dependent oxidoreductase n=1 Tax=Arthrobacter sp. M4 TaxID=218160 RepID=UPI001CDC049D|nr:LLM class flavin-dependent oxidoreductase [Arthrobacter sp. M4]MCA4134984.1 LLM class flavin-dependent oxidoreductase [Arthrobacter sp. M4]